MPRKSATKSLGTVVANAASPNVVRIAIINTEAGYRVRPAFATAHVLDRIRFVNLTGEPIDVELPLGLDFMPTGKMARLDNGGGRDVHIDVAGPAHAKGRPGFRRWQLHYAVFRSKSRALIPGESSPEIIIDEEA